MTSLMLMKQEVPPFVTCDLCRKHTPEMVSVRLPVGNFTICQPCTDVLITQLQKAWGTAAQVPVIHTPDPAVQLVE
jgi:hypothetical protein